MLSSNQGWAVTLDLLALGLLALGLLAFGCEGAPQSNGAKEQVDASTGDSGGAKQLEPPADSFPGHDPPALDELVEQARSKSEPKGDASQYNPREVEVPQLKPTPAEVLPASDQGLPLLVQANGMGLVYDAELSDPITAAGTCMQVATGCVDHVSVDNGRDRDSCVASVRTCSTNHPWDESEPCCSESCQDLYAALRGEDYSQGEAWALTRDSNCFPSMIEFMEAARERDRQAPEE